MNKLNRKEASFCNIMAVMPLKIYTPTTSRQGLILSNAKMLIGQKIKRVCTKYT